MKKFTIFLLTFLLFVGFINVNAQRNAQNPNDSGGTRATDVINSTISAALICASGTNVEVGFTVESGYNPLNNPKIYYTTDPTLAAAVDQFDIYDTGTNVGTNPLTDWVEYDPVGSSTTTPSNAMFWMEFSQMTTTYYFGIVTQSSTDWPVLFTDVVTIPIVPAPTAAIDPFNAVVCDGGDATLTASATWDALNNAFPGGIPEFTYTYEWTIGGAVAETGSYTLGTDVSYTFTGLSQGTHNIGFSIVAIGTDQQPLQGCGDSDTKTITILPKPTLQFYPVGKTNGDSPYVYCENEDFVLTATATVAGYPFQQYGESLEFYDENDNLIHKSGPTSWMTTGTHTYSNPTPFSISAADLGPGEHIYTVKYILTLGGQPLTSCIPEMEITILVNSLPTVTLDGPYVTCETPFNTDACIEVTATATGGNYGIGGGGHHGPHGHYYFEWNTDGIDGIGEQTGRDRDHAVYCIPTLSALEGSISITVTDANGCASTATADVTINPLPEVSLNFPAIYPPAGCSLTNDTAFFLCAGDDPLLLKEYAEPWVSRKYGEFTGTSGLSYDVHHNQTFDPAGLATGTNFTITYTFTDPNTGCVNSDNGIIRVRALPGAVISYDDNLTEFCAEGFSSAATMVGVPPTMTVNLLEKIYTGTPGLVIDANTGVINLETSTPGTHKVYFTFRNCYCWNTDSIEITIHPLPVISLSPATSTICAGDDLTITANVVDVDEIVEYEWSSDIPGAEEDIIYYILNTSTPINNDVITFWAEDEHGCINSKTATVTIRPLPQVEFWADATDLCEGESTMVHTAVYYTGLPINSRIDRVFYNGSTQLFANNTSYIGGSSTNTHHDNITASMLHVGLNQIIVAVSITYGNGSNPLQPTCTKRDTVEIFVKPTQELTLVASPDEVCANGMIELTAEAIIDEFPEGEYQIDFDLYDEEDEFIATCNNDFEITDIDPAATVTCGFSFSAASYDVGEHTFVVKPTIYLITGAGTQQIKACMLDAETTVTILPLPTIAEVTINTKACPTEEVILTAVLEDETLFGQVSFEWFNNDSFTAPIGSNATLTTVGASAPTNYWVVATNFGTGCTDTLKYTLEPVENPVSEILIGQLPELICDNRPLPLSATVNALTGTEQTYQWNYYTSTDCDTHDEGTPIIDTKDGSYYVNVNDPSILCVGFELCINTDGYNCPLCEGPVFVFVTPSIKVTDENPVIDTVCHGGSAPITFVISNHDVNLPVYYRWRVNNIYYDDIFEIYELPVGMNEITMTTLPELHTSENGPESYCFTVEVWQGTVNSFEAECTSISDCHWVVDLKDPVVSLYGPTVVMQNTSDYPVFIADVIGGVGEGSFEWHLNGHIVEGVTGNEFVLDDETVLGTLGEYKIGVKVHQSFSGCDAAWIELDFTVECPEASITIVGPNSGCVGDKVTLTAVVVTDANIEYNVKWRQDGNFVNDGTGNGDNPDNHFATYTFTVTEPIDITEFTAEVSMCGCKIEIAPVHYFQVMPRPVVWVDDYVICDNENASVNVEVNVVNWDGQIYRYVWYDGDDIAIDTTYEPHRLFVMGDFGFDVFDIATYKVQVEMLNAACASNVAEFHITKQAPLAHVDIIAEKTVVCTGVMVNFYLGEDANIEEFGTPTYSWWVNGEQVPGESLNYLNIAFSDFGTHYVEAHIAYPNNVCEYVTDRVDITISCINSVTIIGPHVICDPNDETVLSAVVDPSNLTDLVYQWYKNNTLITDATDATINISELTPSAVPYYYHVVVTDPTSGSSKQSDPFEILVIEYPAIGIVADKTTICLGEQVVLTAPELDENFIGQWYKWGAIEIPGEDGEESTMGEGWVAIAGEVYPVLSQNPSANTTYFYGITQNGTDCEARSNEIYITVKTAPVVTIEVNVTEICEGGAVALTAEPAEGAYTWYENGIIIEGAVSHTIVVFPQTQLGQITNYTYKATVTIEPGCTSAYSNEETVTVNPALQLYVEGEEFVCEGNDVEVHGFAMNFNLDCDLSFTWTIPGIQGVMADPSDYLEGVDTGYYQQFKSLVKAGYPDAFNAVHPTLPNTITEWYVGLGINTILCPGATGWGEQAMYKLGQDQSVIAGLSAGAAAAAAAGSSFVLDPALVAQITAQAALDAEADAQTAGPHIMYPEGYAEGWAYANAAVTDLLKANIIFAVPPFNFSTFTPGNVLPPNPADYIPARYPNPLYPLIGEQYYECPWGVERQENAYKAGYAYGYWLAYGEQFVKTYYKTVINGLTKLYTDQYREVFTANYPEYLIQVLSTGTVTPTGIDGDFSLVIPGGLPARDYPYCIYLTVEGCNGCVQTAAPFCVTVHSAPSVTDITMIPENGLICDGGQVVLTAIVDQPETIAYYIWYENGVEIPGENLQQLLRSPLTVDFDTTNYIYNVVAVPYSGECSSALLESNAKKVHVRRNPILEIHGQHHVCDVYVNYEGYDFIPNVILAAYKDGINYTNYCEDENGNPSLEYTYYTWFQDGAIFSLDNAECEAQNLNIFLHAKSEPYLFKLEYSSPYGCYAMTDEFEVYVHEKAVVNITSTEDTICEGGIVTLTANLNNQNETDYTYYWFDHTLQDTLYHSSYPDYTPPAHYVTGDVTYWVKVRQVTTYNQAQQEESCETIESFTLHVEPKPVITDITIDKDFICSGGQVTLTATLSDNNYGKVPVFTWYRNGFAIDGVTGYTFTESPLAIDDDETVYTYNAIVTYENSGCESVLDENLEVSVTAFRNPVVAISGDKNICETNFVYLHANVDHMSDSVGLLTYNWYESGMLRESFYPDPHGPYYGEYWQPQYEQPYVFTVEVTRGDGCTSFSEPFEVWVYVQPVVNITASEEAICEGGSVTLTANLNDYNADLLTFQWYEVTFENYTIPGESGDEEYTDTVKTLIPGATWIQYQTGALTTTSTFYVEVIQLHSLCFDTDMITIEVAPIPVVVVTNPVDTTICNGQQDTFVVYTTLNDVTVTGVLYQWWENDVIIEGATNATYTPTATAAGMYVYKVQAFIPVSGCTSAITTVGTITVKDAPTVSIEGPSAVCNAAEPTLLYAFVDPIDATVTYQWYLNNEILTDSTGNTITVVNDPSPNPYLYTVEITDTVSGCVILSAVHELYVEQFPAIGIIADKLKVCEDDNTVILTANVESYLNFEYQWFKVIEGDKVEIKGANEPVYQANPDVTTIYTFEAKQIGSECVINSNTITVVVVEIPEVAITEIGDLHICEGGPVILEATYYSGAIYQWLRNGIVIQGAVAHLIVDFPQAQNGLVTEYDYTVNVTVDPGCTSAMSDSVHVTVNPALDAFIEGIDQVCESNNVVLNGFVMNYDPLTGPLNFTWIIPSIEGVPVDPTDYLDGVDTLYHKQFASLLEPGYVDNFETYHPVLKNTADLYEFGAVGTCSAGTSESVMYMIGANDAELDSLGIKAAAAAAQSYADQFIATLVDDIIAQAEMDAIADAAIADPYINFADGAVKGAAYANAFVTQTFKASMIFSVPPYDLLSFTADAQNPNAGTYDPATYLGFMPCPQGIILQNAAYKAGYRYGYWLSYGETFTEDYFNHVLKGITDLYTAEYAQVFRDKLDVTLDVIASGSYIPGEVGEGLVLDVHLPARGYPYRVYLAVTGENGCITTTEPFLVDVIATPIVTAINMTPADGIICDGGQVTLTAIVENPDDVAYYVWYENGFEIEGENLATISVTPLTVDGDPIDYVYNVVAVSSAGMECASALDVELAKTVHVTRNPIVELHGQHHVCDINSGGAHPNPVPNVLIAAFVNGTHGVDVNPEHYKWYRDGNHVIPMLHPIIPQSFNVYLEYRPEPYLIKLEYTTEYGCNAITEVFEVYVHPIQEVNITSTENEICEDGSVTLTANLQYYNESDYTYQWYFGTEDQIGDESAKILGATQPYYVTLPTDAPANTTMYYWVKVNQTTTYNNQTEVLCEVDAMFPLVIHAKPEITAITVDHAFICSGGQVTITAELSEDNYGNNPILTWYRNGVEIEGVTGLSFTESPLAIDDDATVYTYNAIVTYENSACESVLNPDLAVSVTVLRNPNVEIAGDANICENNPVFLTAYVDHTSDEVGILSYTWYENGQERANDQFELIDPHGQYYSEYWPQRYEPYKFTVEVTRDNGCTTMSEPFYVTVHAAPVVNITASETTICEGGEVTLTANLNDYNPDLLTFQWYQYIYTFDSIPVGDEFEYYTDSTKLLIPGATQINYGPVVLNETTDFGVEVFQTHSECISTDMITIEVTEIPVVVLTDTVDAHICNGEQVTMTVSTEIEGMVQNNVTYQWFENGELLTGVITNTYTPTATAAGVYVYKVIATVPTSGCVSLLTYVGTITIGDPIGVSIAGPTTICGNAAGATLHAMITPDYANVTYQWFLNNVAIDGATDSVYYISNLEASAYEYNYTVKITDAVSGCESYSEVHPVTVVEFLTLGIVADKTEVCAGETVLINPTTDLYENYNFDLQWYTWGVIEIEDEEGEEPTYEEGWVAIEGEIFPNLYTYPEVTTTYQLIATQIESGCTAVSNPVTVSVIAAPQIEVEPLDSIYICAGEQVSFNVTLISDDVVTYTWYVNEQEVEGADLESLTYTFDHFGTFVIKVSATSQVAGCTSEVKYVRTVIVKDTPTAIIEGSSVICNTTVPTYLQAIVYPPNATVTYAWYLNNSTTPIVGQVGPSIDIIPFVYPTSEEFIFVVEITDTESGCVFKSLPHTVYVQQYSTIGATADKTEVCAGETVMLEAYVSGADNMIYEWLVVGGSNIPFANTPITYVNPTTTTTYIFHATENGSGCVITSNPVTVEVIPTPVIVITPIIDTICQYEQRTFTANLEFPVNATYTWLINGQKVDDAVTNIFTYNFNESGTFIVEVYATTVDAECSSAIVYAGTITVKFAPSVVISGVHNVCDAVNPADLEAVVTPWNATITYQWFENDSLVGTNPTQPVNTVPSPNPYIYVVVITDYESGCQVVSEPHEVYVTQFNPVSIFSSDNEICVGADLLLTSAGMQQLNNMLWQWYGNGEPIGEPDMETLQFWPTVGTWVFSLKGTQFVSGCTATSNDITVIVNPIPEIPVLTISDETICESAPVIITGDVDGEYTWYINGVETYTGAMSSITEYLTAESGFVTYTYTATVTINNCTSEMSDPITVVVHPAITATIYGEHYVCTQAVEDEHLVLQAMLTGEQAGVNYQYTWYYVQGNNDEVMFFQDINNYYAIVPNDLPVNDAVVPYYFRVCVKAVDYDCTTCSEGHEVFVLPQLTVSIDVDKDAICLSGVIEATAFATPGEGDFVYNYTWFVNGTELANHNPTVSISTYFIVGVNTITCEVQRSSNVGAWVGSCHGSETVTVNVLTAPELSLTQDIEGLQLPGMCIGGELNMCAEIINFDATLVNINNFTYVWTRNGSTLTNVSNSCYSEVLNTAITHNFTVQATYNDASLGCNTVATAFDPVKVVPQPTIEIAPKDYTLFDVCVGATLEIINTLGVVDPNIQVGYQYNWVDTYDWINFTNQIDPRVVEFNIPGTRTFKLVATFENPTCQDATSNELSIKVVNDPVWTDISIDPDVLEGVCIGETVTVCAEFTGGVTDGSNVGTIQWAYNYNGGDFINLTGVGGCKTHKPLEAGEYFYMATYIPAHELSGCDIATGGMVGPMETNAPPTAMFVNEGIPTSCLSNPLGDPVELLIEFTGAAPFNFTIRDDKGIVWNLVSTTNFYSFIVKPTVTTKYTIESCVDFNKCDNSLFAKSEITVVVTDVEILTSYVASCDGVVNIDVLLNSYAIAEATVKFDCITIVAPIINNVTHGTITFNMPTCVPWGPNVAVITIDNCDYNVSIMNNNGGDVDQLIYLRWEGNADVLVVSNNYSDPSNPYYNGGMEFLTYQWYKNGKLIEGATLQHYQHYGEAGVYSVHITGYKVDADGNRLEYVEFVTCGFEVKPSSSIIVYPVPAQVDQPVWIDLTLTPAEMDGAYLDIYDVKGAHIKHINVESSRVKVEGFTAQGAYFGKITTGTNEIKSVKFVIVK